MNEDLKNKFLQDLNQYSGIIHRVCNGYFEDPDERQDVFQEIVYELWRSYESFKGEEKFSKWMYKVALNCAMLHIRKRKKTIQKELLDDTSMQVPVAENNLAADIHELYAAINALEHLDKAIILLYLDEYSYEEIATITGITKTNVSVRIVRIKKKLEEKLKSKQY